MSSILRSPIRQMVKQQFRNVSKSSSVKAPPIVTANPSIIDGATCKVNSLDRRLLVWSGKFHNTNQIPESLPLSTLEFARNKARIYSCNLIMILATAGCISYVAFKKYEANRMELEQRTEEEFIRRINSQI